MNKHRIITPERRKELEKLAVRLARRWDKVKDRYRLYRMTAQVTLHPDNSDGTPNPPTPTGVTRDTLPDFAEYRRAILGLAAAENEYGADDGDVDTIPKLVQETAGFPVTSEENTILWDALNGLFHKENRSLKPLAEKGAKMVNAQKSRRQIKSEICAERWAEWQRWIDTERKHRGWSMPFAQSKAAEHFRVSLKSIKRRTS